MIIALNRLNDGCLVFPQLTPFNREMSSFSKSSSHVRSNTVLHATRRILLALNDEEMALFFPDGFDMPETDITYCGIGCDPQAFENRLRQTDPELVVTSWSTPPFQDGWLDCLPSLRYVCHTSGSVRNLLPRSFLERGVIVTNWGNQVARCVAEHALLLILAGLRHITEWPSVISGERCWQPSPIITRTLYGKRLGLHGFGNVARSLSELVRPFGVEVSAYSEGVPTELYAQQQVTGANDLESLFASSDILIECEALNDHTSGIVTRELLMKLPNGALFVNVGRGAVVDERALAELATTGRISVSLDVYETDPIAPESPLHALEDAVLSPHIAGPTSDQFMRCGELARQNIAAYLQDKPLEAIVSLEIYDRAT